MLLTTPALQPSLEQLIARLDLYDPSHSFGADIDALHAQYFTPGTSSHTAAELFLGWAARFQPCMFGRLGARGAKNIAYDLCWLDADDIAAGDLHLINKIQSARRAWKDRAVNGLASGFLIMFCDPLLARAKPGQALLDVCRRVSELYVIEHAPLEDDTIYTEAIPLRSENSIGVFKAGINVFYPSAHRTLNHDRRVPGGLLISVNSPGHLANSMVLRGKQPNLQAAVEQIFEIAIHSIGNGGIGDEATTTTSWHQTEDDPQALAARCPIAHRAPHVPENFSGRKYSAYYHTDVLLPSAVTRDATTDPDRSQAEVWPWLVIDYISTQVVDFNHVNYALFHPHPIQDEAIYHNPWPPRRARNSALFDY